MEQNVGGNKYYEEVREHTAGGKLRPSAIAHAIVLFPVPLGPMIIFKYGPGVNSTKS